LGIVKTVLKMINVLLYYALRARVVIVLKILIVLLITVLIKFVHIAYITQIVKNITLATVAVNVYKINFISYGGSYLH
jgi:hypothetical protein